MDVLAARLAQSTKSKSTKKLAKKDSKKNKEKTIAKVDSVSFKKSLKKKDAKKISKEVTNSKKELLLKNLAEKVDKNLVKIVKSLKKIPSNTQSEKKIGVLKTVDNVILKKNKKSKKDIEATKPLITVESNSSGTVNQLKKKDKLEKKNLATIKQKKSKPIESKVLKNVSTKENIKKLKKQTVETVVPKENKIVKKVLKNDSSKENIKLTKKVKKQIVAEIVAPKENKIVKKESTKKKISTDAKEDQPITSKLKKTKTKSDKLIKTENNGEIENIKSKKRKLEETKKSDKLENPYPTRKEVVKCIKALLKLVEIEEDKKKNLFNSEKPSINMHVTCIKIPKTPLHQMRILLPHSMVKATDDVALFVKDLKKGRRRDPEDSIHHYENILKENECTQIKTVIPLNQVKTEFRPFEMRRRLVSSYDYFLVDGTISGHMAHLLGKTFRKSRKLPTSIHMKRKDLKTEIDTALRKTSLEVHATGDSSTVKIGHCAMSVEEIADNIMATIQELSKNYPGGWENIRSLRIKTPLGISIPVYLTLKSKNEVAVPVQPPKRPKAFQEVEGELSTFNSNTKVIVLPEGTVRVVKTRDDTDAEAKDDDNYKDEDEIESENEDENESDNEDEN